MLELKKLTKKYIHKLRKWRNQPEIKEYFIYNEDISSEQQENWYKEYTSDNRDHFFIVFEDSKPIGGVGLYIDPMWRIAEFGRLMIGEKSARGKQYGTEITEMACNYAFDELDIILVTLEVFEDNERAIKAYERVGFKVKDTRTERNKKMLIMAYHVEDR